MNVATARALLRTAATYRRLHVVPVRDPVQRRAYAGRPADYFRDILGWTLTPQQDAALALMEREHRVLIPSGNNVGKTFVLAGYGVYLMDAVAALPGEHDREQGARILLPGPDHDTVFETVYSEMLTHAARAEARGYAMPGERSEKSVLWRVRPKWHVEVLSPPRRVGQSVAHTASGRHHRNQHALIEEGQGVDESLWLAAEGMCSSAGNKVISPFNPTEPVGPAFQRSRSGAYQVLHLSAFLHPNVVERALVIPDAVDFRVIDRRVLSQCQPRGDVPAVPEHHDFRYALPPPRAPEHGARADGVLGHPDGTVRTYRPNAAFTSQVIGAWPATSDSGLFNAGDWDQGVQRWRLGTDPDEPPDAVGVDPAREGSDDPAACPRWGSSLADLLIAYALAEEDGTVDAVRAERRIRSGAVQILAKGDGVDVARALDRAFPGSPFNVDEGGVGSSPHDHLSRVLGRDSTPVSFGAAPLPVVPAEPYTDNIRTQLYVRAAMGVARGLVDPPDDLVLREEILAHETRHSTRTVVVDDPKRRRKVKQRMPSLQLIEKDQIKRRIGRSPDRADAWVLSLFDPPRRAPRDLSGYPVIQR